MDHNREKAPTAPPSAPFSAPQQCRADTAGCFSTSNSPNQWPMYTHPPDAFLSLFHNPQTPPFPPMPHPSNFPPLQQGQPSMENFHFVGVPSQLGSFSTPPPPPPTKGIPSSSQPASDKVAPPARGSLIKKKKKLTINLEEDPEPSRTAQRLSWTTEEEKRLASAWLENSNDPIDGNSKKIDKYWNDIAAAYNSTTPSHRKRDAAQLKQHFHKVKAKINAFHGEYCAVTKVYRSGYSDDKLQAMVLEKYEADKGTSFSHLLMWRILKDNGKWLALVAKLNGEEDKSPTTRIDVTSHALNVDGEKRPPGRHTAKAERLGKCKARETPEVVTALGDKLDKFIEVQAVSKQERQKVIESQQRLSSEKLQTAKLAKETKMLDVYQNLLLADTSVMDENAKAARARVLASMESMLFPQDS